MASSILCGDDKQTGLIISIGPASVRDARVLSNVAADSYRESHGSTDSIERFVFESFVDHNRHQSAKSFLNYR
jgi:hypothetical protein